MCDSGLIGPGDQDVIIPAHSLKTKLASDERLTTSQSDHLFRVAHTIALTESFFGNTDKAMCWLSKPKCSFRWKVSGVAQTMFSVTGQKREGRIGQILELLSAVYEVPTAAVTRAL